MTDLIERAKAALEGVDVFNEWLLFHPIARALIETTADRDHLQAKVAGMQALCDNLAGEVEKAVSERTEELRHQVERYGDQIDTLTAERDALRVLLVEARDELAECANADWPEPSRSHYPDIMRRWKRDMDLCWRIDAALQEGTPND